MVVRGVLLPVMSKDSARFSRLGVLAPAALSACMDASVLAVPAAGAIVSTVLKELSKAFMLKKWFHGIMSAKEAEHLIMEKGKNGSFLVRESQAHPGEFVLSVRVRGRVSHVMIRRQHNKYDVGSGEQFDDLVGLIEHFRSYPMIETSGDVLRLLQPVGSARLPELHKTAEAQEIEESQKMESNNRLDNEFVSLQMEEDCHEFTTNEALKTENAQKNRYRNILPYDHTRVILHQRDKDETEYINANYIRPARAAPNSVQSSNESLHSVHSLIIRSETRKPTVLVSKSLSDDALRHVKKSAKLDKINGNLPNDIIKDKTYIAAQGCLPHTKGDFWRMIWQEDVRIIAMITNETEKGKKKCERYWPSEGQEQRLGAITVRGVAETLHEDYVMRELDVTRQGCCRTVYQYQFTAWPDHGAPPDPGGVLDMIRDINRRLAYIRLDKVPPEQNVVCVHCSAGVGRTGSFIVLDMILDELKTSGFNCDIDVRRTVKLVRAQRQGSVQNKAQYRFIHRAIEKYIEDNKLRRTQKVYLSEA